MVKKFEITQSMIHLFEKCGRAFELRYLENLKIPPQAAQTLGRSVDIGITHNLSQKIKSEVDLSIEAVTAKTSDAFEAEAPQTDWQGGDPGKQKDIAIQLVKAHHEHLAPLIQPQAVQVKLTAERVHYTLGGTLDLIEKTGVVVDHKTSKAVYDENAVTAHLQPAMYSHLFAQTYGEPPKGFRYDILIKPTIRIPARTQQVLGIVGELQEKVLLKRADVLYSAIHTGTFHYAPDGAWYCSSKWCGYWNECERGGKKS